MSRGLGNTPTNIPPVSQLANLSRDQLISLLDTVGKLSHNSQSVMSNLQCLTERQNAVDKKLDRAIRDVEAKASDLARFHKADYKPLTDASVDKYTVWRTRFITQLKCHGLAQYLTPEYRDHYVDVVSLSCHDQVFDDNSALLEKYEYLLNKIDELIVKQTTFVKTVFEDVFQDSLAAEFVKMSDNKPHEIWAEIDNAFTTVTLNKSANAVREFTNFNRMPGEGLCQFIY